MAGDGAVSVGNFQIAFVVECACGTGVQFIKAMFIGKFVAIDIYFRPGSGVSRGKYDVG